MNAWTNGPGRTQSSCELRTLLSVALALSISVTLLSSSGCEISVDSSASSSAGSNDVAQGGSGTAGHESTTDPTAANDAPADPTPSDPLNPNLRKDASPTPDSRQSDPATADPATADPATADPATAEPATPDAPTPNSPDSDSPNSDTAKNDALKGGSPHNDVAKSDATKPDARNADSPKPDAPNPNSSRPDAVNAAGRAPAGPKKELLPIESTARSALAREPGIEVITFDDLNLGMQADMVFRDFLLNDRVRELEGQKVRLIGYMHGGVSQLKGLREFVLLRNNECKFGPGGLADHLVRVFMKSEPGADYTTSAMQIDGVLKVNPFQGPDGNTWSVYDIEAQSIKIIKK